MDQKQEWGPLIPCRGRLTLTRRRPCALRHKMVARPSAFWRTSFFYI